MADRLRVWLAQIDQIVGDVEGNAERIEAAWRAAAAAGDDLIVLPEMAIAGFQTQDLVLKPAFIAACEAAIETLAARFSDGPAALVGGPALREDALYNAVWLLEGGAVKGVFRKWDLPNYGVFDDKRLFTPGPESGPIAVRGARIGVPICEDAWTPHLAETLAESGAEILIVPNGSPYARGKYEIDRIPRMVARVVETGLPLAYLNLVGGQDDQVFDGGSFALDQGGALAAQAPFFEEAALRVTFERGPNGWRCRRTDPETPLATPPDGLEADYHAMVAGLRGYFAKNGFKEALLGLSGGVDSALTAAIAADALGPENVRAVMLPSKFTSAESLEDAAACAEAIGCRLETVPIESGVDALEAALAPFFAGLPRGLTEENLQSRLRGLYLMALSNKTGALLLTTGNKSEVAVGYATLYGDMCGAYNPLKDLYKTRVFSICRWRNAQHRAWMKGAAAPVIPKRIIDKPPSAELREDQKDEDSLPPYEVLDAILERLIEQDASLSEIVADGYDRATVEAVERLVYLSEYKRCQAAPGPKLGPRAFWLDRRYPITNRWRDRG
ncbi:MAG: NAD+ synthase [Pseudomonadota bacterium]